VTISARYQFGVQSVCEISKVEVKDIMLTFKIKEEKETHVKGKEKIDIDKLVSLDFVGLKYVFRSNYLVDKQ
jgi:hypothetical protein